MEPICYLVADLLVHSAPETRAAAPRVNNPNEAMQEETASTRNLQSASERQPAAAEVMDNANGMRNSPELDDREPRPHMPRYPDVRCANDTPRIVLELNDRSITRLRVGDKHNLSLPVSVLLYNAKVLFRDIKICKLILCKAETLLFLLKVISFSFLN